MGGRGSRISTSKACATYLIWALSVGWATDNALRPVDPVRKEPALPTGKTKTVAGVGGDDGQARTGTPPGEGAHGRGGAHPGRRPPRRPDHPGDREIPEDERPRRPLPRDQEAHRGGPAGLGPPLPGPAGDPRRGPRPPAAGAGRGCRGGRYPLRGEEAP